MRKKKIQNRWESQADDVLRAYLAGTGYRVYAAVAMKDVIDREPKEELGKTLREHLQASHFDFVVTNQQGEAEFAIEFDGMSHHTQPEQREADVRKNQLCHLAELPLWRIDSTELEERGAYSILAFMIQRFVAWRQEAEGIGQAIAEYVSMLDEGRRSMLIAEGVLDSSIDPSCQFDLRHPFPETREVARRLLERYNAVGVLARPLLKAVPAGHTYRLFYDVFAALSEAGDGGDHVVRRGYAICLADKPSRDVEMLSREDGRRSMTVLQRGWTEFRIKSTLPIVHDYDWSESVCDYVTRTDKIPVWCVGLPGVTPQQVARHMSEYFALLEVEKWIEDNEPL